MSRRARTQPDRARTQPDRARTQPDRARTQPDRARTQPDGARTQPDGARTQPDGARTQPDGARRSRRAPASRLVQGLTAAGAVVAAATAAVVIDAAAGTGERGSGEVRTVTVTPGDRLEPIVTAEAPLAVELAESMEARTQLVATAAAEVDAVPEPAPEPEPEPEPVPVPEPAPEPATPGGATDTGVWERIAECESGGNWSINTGNGFYGGLQFTLDSWQWVGGSGYPHEASRAEQIRRGEILLERQGWQAWPSCSRQLGLR
ncbi:transglycosylase family protein [Egicoccus halophilus]|uniref:Resuscitation-promoting factor core lysozyme-like domain-containing protein n=1 Tax=Egicoccus halophilus TaxID=1670830 RepID=A0A8J3ET96_9ACTN|nr:transglycosylase family protein [Egicoccus halophilus]GGI09074.1 hypothetical protein GCM10011354_32260 [Egicoccus halophilus]